MFKDSGDNVFLLIQALGLIAFLCTTVSYWGKGKKQILAIQIVGDIFYATHYFLLGAITGGLTQVLGLFRETSFFCAKTKKQEKIIFVILVPIYLFIGCMTSTTIIEIFPILASNMIFDSKCILPTSSTCIIAHIVNKKETLYTFPLLSRIIHFFFTMN